MTTKKFSKELQDSLEQNGFSNKIEKASESMGTTYVRFENPIDEKLALWLNEKYYNDFSLSSQTDKNLCMINTRVYC